MAGECIDARPLSVILMVVVVVVVVVGVVVVVVSFFFPRSCPFPFPFPFLFSSSSVPRSFSSSPPPSSLDEDDNNNNEDRLIPFSTSNALCTLSPVKRLMTPSVRCKVPTGLIAVSGMPSGRSLVGLVTLSLKLDSDDWSWDFEAGVTRGRQRKCVNRAGADFGGILSALLNEVGSLLIDTYVGR